MASTSPFLWGQGGQKLTPAQVAQMRQTAAALAARNGAPKDVGEGLSAIGNALVYRSNMDRASEAEQKGQSAVAEALAAAQGGGDPNAFLGVIGNEWASPEQRAVAQALYQKSQPDYQTFESNGDIYRYNQNDPNSKPSMFFDAPDAPAVPDYGFQFAPDGSLIRTDKTSGTAESVGQYTKPADPGFIQLTPEEAKARNLDPNKAWQRGPDNKIYEIGGGGTNVTINNGEQDSPLNKALSEAEGKAWNGFKEAATVSGASLQDFQVLGELANMAPQGPITGRLAQAFPGFNAAGDAFQSIVKRVAPTLRAPGSGSTSDIEYQGMLNSLPSLQNTPEANAMILSIMQAKADINIKRGEIITKYQNGELSVKDARAQLNELNRTSIMTPEMQKALQGISSQQQPDTGAAGEQSQANPEVFNIPDGATATNPKTGEKIVYKNGQWVPVM